MLTVHSKSGEAQERSADGKFGQVVVKKASGTHECPICLEKFSHATLKKHMTKALNRSNYQCAKCDYVAKTKADRDQHESMCLRGCDEGKAIVCKTCKMSHHSHGGSIKSSAPTRTSKLSGRWARLNTVRSSMTTRNIYRT